MNVDAWGPLQRSGFEHSVAVVNERRPALAPTLCSTIDVLLQDRVAHPDQVAAWTTSLLTCNGAPLEFSFSTLSEDVRYTVEVGGPDTSPRERLDRIDSLAASLGWGEPCSEVTCQLRGLQSGAAPRWGAWLGVRHRLDGGCPDYKIYAEVLPENALAASGMIETYLISAPALSGQELPLVMVGRSPGSERGEFYFELPSRRLEAGDLERLLALVHLAERCEDLEELILSCELSSGAGRQSGLPDAQYGVSYSVLPGGLDPVLSIFAFAAELLGGDGIVRYQMLSAALSRGWTLGLYPFITEPVARRFFRPTYHNMVSFMVGQSPVAGLHVRVSPPPVGLHDDR